MKDTRRTRVVLGALLVVALTMITVDYRGGADSPLRGLRGVGATVFGPVERASASVVRPVSDTFDAITDAPGERRRADRLERQNQRLREQLRSTRLDQDRSAQLQRLLGTAGMGGYKIRAAQVISAGQGFEDTVTIDVGSRNGIKPDMTVMSADGLVGRVTRVGPATSTVLLATDQTSSIGSRLEDSKEIGITQGRGRRGLGGAARRRCGSSSWTPPRRSASASGSSRSGRRASGRTSRASRSAWSSGSRRPPAG